MSSDNDHSDSEITPDSIHVIKACEAYKKKTFNKVKELNQKKIGLRGGDRVQMKRKIHTQEAKAYAWHDRIAELKKRRRSQKDVIKTSEKLKKKKPTKKVTIA